MKHTPGPWHAETAPCGTRVGLMSLATGGAICMLGIKSALNSADVKLIEAAPDLLEACEALIRSPGSAAALQQATLAVRKALGETD